MAAPAQRLFDGLFASDAMAGVFSDRSRVQAMLDFEAALARSEAETGVVPRPAAAAIVSQCRADLFDLEALAEGTVLAGNAAIPLVKTLTKRVERRDPDAARYVHWGATSQDAVDTGLVLQLRSALSLFDADLARLNDALAVLAQSHRHTVMLGRTWMQPAPPVTFGLKVAGWLSAFDRERDRLRELRGRALVIQFGGAVGTLAALGGKGLEVALRLAEELHLAVPDLPWHSHRDRIAETGALLGLLAGNLGKMARDLALMLQSEVAEVSEPRVPGRSGSSTMPHKQNPVGIAAMLAVATRVPAQIATLYAAMPQEHECGLGGWEAEWEALPEICVLTASSLAHGVRVIEGLEVDGERMRDNLDAMRGVVLAEPIALLLARHLDRGAAHEILARACRRAAIEGRGLREVLAQDRVATAHVSAAELDRLFDPTAYLGVAEQWIDRVLASHAAKRSWGQA
jgi:3-carboxy-cis,cis-muconate cycloisomerase